MARTSANWTALKASTYRFWPAGAVEETGASERRVSTLSCPPMTVCYVETGMGQALRLRAADHSTLIRRADHCLCSSDQSAASDINQPF